MSRPHIALAALAVSISGLAVADQADLGPLDPRASSPSSQIETGLEAYRLFADEPRKDWKDANREAFEAAVEMGLPEPNEPPAGDGSRRSRPARTGFVGLASGRLIGTDFRRRRSRREPESWEHTK
jgi:hypothetical protein